MKKSIMVLSALMAMVFASGMEAKANEFVQKDGLFKMDIPDGWKGLDMSGRVLILPPPPDGGGIVIQYKPSQETPNQIKAKIGSDFDDIIESKIKPAGGNVLNEQEMTIDGVYARYLLYAVSLKGENMYWVRFELINKGYAFSIDYGNPAQAEVEKIVHVVETLKF